VSDVTGLGIAAASIVSAVALTLGGSPAVAFLVAGIVLAPWTLDVSRANQLHETTTDDN
jgi:predicted Kef-type K+ transport protein